jgi:hypothetical protein
VLITSRPQEKDQIIKGLQEEEARGVVDLEMEPFSFNQKVLMLQTRLNIEENK